MIPPRPQATAEAHFELAMAAVQSNRSEEASEHLQSVLEIDRNHNRARRLLADLMQTAGNFTSACELYKELFEFGRNDSTLFESFGFCCQQLQEWQLAEKAYLRTLHLGRDSAELRFNLGVVRLKQNRLPEAILAFEEALRINPRLPGTHLAIANAKRLMADDAGALEQLQNELSLNPACAEAAINLGTLLQERHRVQDAIICYRQALAIHPDHPILHWNLAIASLLAGEFETGWREYEWRWKTGRNTKPSFSRPEWDGRDLAGRTLLVYAEQGLGDTIMFSRFASEVSQRNGRVILRCQHGLKRLLQSLPGTDAVIDPADPLPHFDFHAPLLSLPFLLKFHPDGGTPARAYLQAPNASRLRLPQRNHARLKIGIVWAGNPNNPEDSRRSVPLQAMTPLLRHPGLSCFSLQLGPAAENLRTNEYADAVADLSPYLSDFADTAAAIAQLDLVVTADTAAAHLAGALGAPVWVMLPFACDWRWLLQRSDTIWYPRMRLFRQCRAGAWAAVVDDIVGELSSEAQKTR